MTPKSNTAKTEAVEAAATTEAKKSYPTTEQMIKDGMTTKSARIRHLHSLGMPVGDIARQETGGLYQHAYNVIKKPLKGRKPVEATVEAPQEEVKESASSKTESAPVKQTASKKQAA